MPTTGFKDLAVFQIAEELCDAVWDVVRAWDHLPRDTVGKRLIRAADSVGANIVEGCGRQSYQDNRRFVRIARGSLNETQYWLRRAYRRKLLTKEQTDRIQPLLAALGPRLNAYLKSIGRTVPNSGRPTQGSERMTND